MKFLYPEFLWAFFLLIIPIIIHLFNFKRYKTLYFSSLSFIKHVDQQTKSTQKIKHILILFSRLLALSFLILAFAQPYFDREGNKSLTKDHVSVIYLDNSYSMQSRGPEGELLSEAREKAKELINSSPMNSKFMVITNDLTGREERILNKVEALEKIDNTTYSPLAKSLNQIISWKNDKILRRSELEQIDLFSSTYLFSDFQASTNNDVITLDSLRGNYYPIQLVSEDKDNLLVDSVWFTSPNHTINSRAELNFRIRNNSEQDIENAELNIRIEDFEKTVFVNIPKNGSKSSSITYTDKTHGNKRGSITVMDKHIFFDDAFYFNYHVHPNADVLILNGEDQVDNIELIVLSLISHHL